MKQQEFTTHFEGMVTKMRETLLKKGNDYSSNKDRLDNFKNAGAVTGIGPEMTCVNLMAVKINRLSNLMLSGAKPENESLIDNSLDLLCYAMLLTAIQADAVKTDKL